MATKSTAWTGWVAFAACTLIVLGALNLIQGFVALFSDDYFVSRSGDLMVWDFTAWGVILLIFGGLQLLIGMGLLTGSGVSRVLAAILVMVNIVAQIAFLAAYPVWSTIVIALDIFVLYALTARWDAAMGGRSTHSHPEATWQADEAADTTSQSAGAHRRTMS
ncbi:hypothetical protein [Streptomyces sp. SID3343]|uniref:DUF7144 family membrane protein n=1 Tax=Streptomyces sp. SID3343 TaxID=2690260 RepID=UPI00136C335C|nr:hypothetical protein [Streptomyces sp. SID3343]MYW01716.1 hypothetical protein [Streptomyces sp. SID3343]